MGYNCIAFADAKKEIENCIKKDANSKQFQQANEKICFLEETGNKLTEQGKFNEAMQCYNKALVQADKLYGKESTASAMIYTCIGKLLLKKGHKLKAAESFVKASDIFKKSMGGIVTPKADRLLLIHAGFIYYNLKLFGKAWETLTKAERDISKLTPNERKKYTPRLYRYLAFSLYYEKKYKQAIGYLKITQKLELQQKAVNCQELAVISLFLGEALFKTKQFEKSLSSLLKSKKYFDRCKPSTFYQFKLYLSLSLVNENLGKNKENLLYAKKLNDICEKFKSTDFKKIVGLICLADAMYNNNQKENAVKLMQQALMIAKTQNHPQKTILRIKKHLQDIIEN